MRALAVVTVVLVALAGCEPAAPAPEQDLAVAVPASYQFTVDTHVGDEPVTVTFRHGDDGTHITAARGGVVWLEVVTTDRTVVRVAGPAGADDTGVAPDATSSLLAELADGRWVSVETSGEHAQPDVVAIVLAHTTELRQATSTTYEATLDIEAARREIDAQLRAVLPVALPDADARPTGPATVVLHVANGELARVDLPAGALGALVGGRTPHATSVVLRDARPLPDVGRPVALSPDERLALRLAVASSPGTRQQADELAATVVAAQAEHFLDHQRFATTLGELGVAGSAEFDVAVCTTTGGFAVTVVHVSGWPAVTRSSHPSVDCTPAG